MKIKAAVAREAKKPLQIEEVEIREPNSTEILVKMIACGVCHTDEVARNQEIPVPLPAVLGHEGSGIVEAVGDFVTEFKPGDHVVLTFGSCGTCEFCLSGKLYVCSKMLDINFGGTLQHGAHSLCQGHEEVSTFFCQSSFATYAIADSTNAVKVDKEIDLALLGPLGCGIQTGAGAVLNCLNPEFGSTIAIFGCGGVGLSAIMAAKISKCKTIIAVDIFNDKLALAKELGATHVINSLKVKDVASEIKKLTQDGVNYAVETTGVPNVINAALYSLKSLGKLVILGVAGEVSIDLYQALMGEGKSMIGVIEGNSNPKLFIPKLIEYYKKGQFPIDKLVTYYSFEEINQAFEDTKKGKVIKPIIKLS